MKVTIDYDPTWEALDWVKKNCASYITNDSHQDQHHVYDHTKIDYFFGEERDATLFLLRWT